MVNLTSASNHRIEVLGMVKLSVTIATYTARVPFVVVRTLGADALLGCEYQDLHVETIKPRRRTCESDNGDVAPIIRRAAARPRLVSLDEPNIVGKRSIANFNGLRVTKRVTIPPRCWRMVDVTSHHNGMSLIEGGQDLWEKKGIMVAAGVADVNANRMFKVRVANFTTQPVELQKRERIGSSLPVPVPAEPHEVTEIEAGKPDHEGFFNPEEILEP